jgi:glyoxylase-like metal-dependent hydrolase (beta-lactamase superfamily II)
MSLHWGGPEIVLEHHPGSYAGSIWVIIPSEQVVFVGDTVVPDQPPFLANAELNDWINSLELLATSYRDYIIISGRGGPVAGEAIRLQQKILNV